jgi:solute carrier family 25 phosphate transporter 23/24/25/41
MVTLVSGGVAGAISRTTTAPCDRVKVILQARTSGESTSILNEMRKIYTENGFKGFFKGNGTNVLKIIPETALKFLIYDEIKKLICTNVQSPTTSERLFSGAASGFITQTFVYPLEITKTRLALAKDGVYKGIGDCLRQIVRTEGPRALYKGWGASVLGIMPYASIDLTMFNILRENYIKRVGADPSVYVVLACGAFSSICGQVVSYPFALVRTRLQSQGLPGKPVLYNGMVDCVRKTWGKEGLPGFYRGILPNFMKSVPAVAISYAVFDKMKSFMTK